MGYFDSPKNRAMWKRELEQLRQQREARKNGFREEAFAAQKVQRAERQAEQHPLRERVTYDQLLREERAHAAGMHRSAAKTAPAVSKQKEMGGPEL